MESYTYSINPTRKNEAVVLRSYFFAPIRISLRWRRDDHTDKHLDPSGLRQNLEPTITSTRGRCKSTQARCKSCCKSTRARCKSCCKSRQLSWQRVARQVGLLWLCRVPPKSSVRAIGCNSWLARKLDS